MKLIKNICKTIFILIGIALMVVMFSFAVMMIGKVSIFGYTYVQYENVERQVFDSAIYSDVTVNTNGVAVEIIGNSSDTSLAARLESYVQGICKDDVKDVTFDYVAEGNSLTISTKEPTGLIFNNSSVLKIYIPSGYGIDDLSIKAGTNKISFSNELNLDNLSIETTNSIRSLTLSANVTVAEQLNLKTQAGRFNVNSEILGDINIDSTVGTFIFNSSVGNGNSNVTITGNTPSVEFGDIDNKNSNVDVNGNISITCTNGGLVKVSGTVYGTTGLNSNGIEYRVKNQNGILTTNLGENGSIAAIYIYGDLCKENNEVCTINSGSGSVYIKNCYSSNINISSSKNDVTIDNLYGSATITNDYGSTKVVCANDINSSSVVDVVSKNGSIDVKNISCQVSLKTEKSSINAEFVDVVGNNTLQSNYDVSVKVKDIRPDGHSSMQYKLTVASKTGKVDVQLGGDAEFSNWDDATTVDGYKTISTYVNSANENITNNIDIKTNSGKISASIY